MERVETAYPLDTGSEFDDPTAKVYDNMPLNGRPTNAGRTRYHWRVPINQVTPEQRDNRVLDSAMELILEECGQNEPLSLDRTIELMVAKQAGDKQAKQDLINHNLGLVVHLAKKFYPYARNHGFEMADLFQTGCIGLIQAIEKSDPAKCVRANSFSTYCGAYITNALQRSMANQGRLVRIPVHIDVQIKHQVRVINALQQELGREPTIEQIAERIAGYPPAPPKMETDNEGWVMGDVPEHELVRSIAQHPYAVLTAIAKAKAIKNTPIKITQLDWLLESDKPEHEQALIDPDTDVEGVVVGSIKHDQLVLALQKLPPRTKHILELRYGLLDGNPRTLDYIGHEVDLTRERVRQIVFQGIWTLSKDMELSSAVSEAEPRPAKK